MSDWYDSSSGPVPADNNLLNGSIGLSGTISIAQHVVILLMTSTAIQRFFAKLVYHVSLSCRTLIKWIEALNWKIYMLSLNENMLL